MGIVRPTMALFPWAWLFFLPFIIITSFAVLNFFIGIIVDSMQIAQKMEAEANGPQPTDPATQADVAQVLSELTALRAELAALKAREKEGDSVG